MKSYAVLQREEHEAVLGFHELVVSERGLSFFHPEAPCLNTVDLAERRPHEDSGCLLGGLKGVDHPPAQPQCCCGVSGWSTPLILGEDGYYGMEMASALCAFWGDLVLHGNRVEASHGRILALGYPPASIHEPQAGDLERAAAALDVPLLDWEVLRQRGLPLKQLLDSIPVREGRPWLLDGLVFAPADPLPAFRVRIDNCKGLVTPWYFAGTDLTRLRSYRPEAEVLGDIYAVDDTHARVRLSRCPEERRLATSIQLQRWAERDGWSLEIEPGLHPLAFYDGEHRRRLECSRCHDFGYLSYIAGMAASQRGYFRTVCHLCGGRMRLVPNP